MRRALFAAVAAVALAATSAASIRPSELNGTIAAREPYGAASLTWLFLTAYDSRLWMDAPTWSMDVAFALSIDYRMSFTREELAERTIDEMRKVSPDLTPAMLARFGVSLSKAYPAVKSGDRVTALHTPGRTVRFYRNGRMTGEVEDPAFAAPFFGIWLSPKTSEPALRAGLLRLSR